MHIKPKKGLGQNFLFDKNIQNKIISACEFKKHDVILEIGAGRGELTRLMAPLDLCIYAVEIDPCLSANLKQDFKRYQNVEIISRDILKINLNRRFNKLAGRIKVIGNIPYYISTPIIERLLKVSNKINSIFITVQKEFAKRVAAIPGSKDYGSLSCFVQYHANPKILFYIKKSCFFPMPKVDSCFLRLDIRQQPLVKPKNEKLFFRIIRASFNQRRKTLRNSLKDILSAQKLSIFFKRYGIDPNIRPEGLSLQDFANMASI